MFVSMILACYANLLIIVGIFTLSLMLLGFYFLTRRSRVKKISQILPETISPPMPIELTPKPTQQPPQSQKGSLTITSQDIHAISGEDTLATQLDLARAYIETGRKQLAKKILVHVAEQGDDLQQAEAKELLGYV